MMNWKDILKVDVYFDKDLQGLGMYQYDDLFDIQRIRLNHQLIYRSLKDRLGREPTEKEIMEAVKRTAMHEGAHASHSQADPKSFKNRGKGHYPLEVIANLLEFPESLYIAFKNLLRHTASMKPVRYHGGLLHGSIKGYEFHADAQVISDLMRWVDRHAKKSADKEKLIRIEMAQRKDLKRFAKRNLPMDLKSAIIRYGPKHREFLKTLRW
jgi:hypothetical protein